MKILTIKRFFYLCILVAATGVGIIVSAQNPDVRGMGGGAGITVFVDPNFRGKAATYTYDITNLAQTGFNDRISSVRVAAGERWEICEHANYAGNCVIVFGQERNLRQNNWDNKISSLRRVTGDRPDRPDRPSPGYSSIILFTQPNYRGNREDYTRTTPNLLGMNDRAASVTVEEGQWQLCDGINFTGNCTTITQSISNLGSIGMLNRVSSVRPMSGGGGGGGGYPTPGYGITLFARDNFQGAQSRYTTARPNISKPTGSITIGPGRWQVCDRPNYMGRCQTLESSVSDTSSFNIGRIIRSVRPR
jgi:hypothetical protein